MEKLITSYCDGEKTQHCDLMGEISDSSSSSAHYNRCIVSISKERTNNTVVMNCIEWASRKTHMPHSGNSKNSSYNSHIWFCLPMHLLAVSSIMIKHHF